MQKEFFVPKPGKLPGGYAISPDLYSIFFE